MSIICPHCRNSIETAQLSASKEILCPSCGSGFRLEGGSTTGWGSEGGTEKLGRFDLLQAVGSGAFGTVYKARDPKLDRIVAVKVPHGGKLAPGADHDRFLREARSAAQLRHPAIVSVHEVGTVDEAPYLVSDFVEGVTLSDWLTAHEPTPKEAALLAASVAEALAYAHRQGVVHRDVKPSNIMLGADGAPQLMDFGLAKREAGDPTVTLEGQVLGTPAYMSPEQARGDGHRVDGRSDLYSLGVVLYRMLTGRLPFQGNARMLLHQVLHDEPRPPRRHNGDIPRDLETICLKAMAKEPARRYPTADALADDLRRFVRGEPVQARPAGSGERLRRWCGRNPVVAGLFAVVFLSLTGGASAVTYFALRVRETTDDVRQAKDALLKQRAAQEVSDRGTRFDLYAHGLTQADNAWRAGQLAQARRLLQQCPEEFRQWEWRLLDRMYQETGRTLPGHTGAVSALAYSPDGRLAASYSIGAATVEPGSKTVRLRPEVKVWDLGTGKETVSLQGATAPFRALAFRPDGERLVGVGILGDKDRSLALLATWSVRTGELLTSLKIPVASLFGVALSTDASRLATYSSLRGPPDRASRVQIWDTASGAEQRSLPEIAALVTRLAFGPSGQELVVVTVEAVPQSGKSAATASTFGVTIWRADRGEKTASFQALPRAVVEAALSPDGRRLAVAWNDTRPPENKQFGVVKVWDVPSGQEAYTVKVATGWISGGLAFSPDGRYLACGDPMVREKGSGIVNVWDAQTGTEAATLRGHVGEVLAVAFGPDSRQLISGGRDKTLRAWDVASEPGVLNLNGQAVALSPDGQGVATAGNGFVTLWDGASGQSRRTAPSSLLGPVVRMAYDMDGQHLSAVSVRKDEARKKYVAGVKVREVATGAEAASFPLEGHSWSKFLEIGTGPTLPVAFSRDGRRLAVVSDSPEGANPAARTLAVWDLATRRPLFVGELAIGDVFGLAFRPDGQQLAVGGGRSWQIPLEAAPAQPPTGQVRLLDAQTGQERLAFQAQAVGMNALDYSPDGQHLVTAGRDGAIQVWDAATGAAVSSFRDPSQKIWHVAYSPDGHRLATASGDHTITFWEPRQGRLVFSLRRHPTGVNYLAFSRDGQRLASVGVASEGGNGLVKVWDAGGRPAEGR